eukprot:scaffold6.g2594.t1
MFPFGWPPGGGGALSQCFDKAALVEGQRVARREMEEMEELQRSGRLFHMRTTTSGGAPPGAGASPALGALRPVRVRELELGRVHRGRVLAGRVCGPAVKMTAVQLVLESEAEPGTAVKLSIYNMVPLEERARARAPPERPRAATARQLDRLFPEGTSVLVYADGCAGLRVDDPADVVLEPPTPPGLAPEELAAVADPRELRRRGNACFEQGDYESALRCYDQWLAAAPGDAVALGNKAAALVQLEQWEQAYLAAEEAHRAAPDNPKYRFRLGTALMRLRCYAGAAEHLRAVRAKLGKDKAAAAALREAEERAAESEGRFSTRKLYFSGGGGQEFGDYVGPIGVVQSPGAGELVPSELLVFCAVLRSERRQAGADAAASAGRRRMPGVAPRATSILRWPTAGRGLALTRAVKAGELLLAENAYALAQPGAGLALCPARGTMDTLSTQELMGRMHAKCSASALDRLRLLSLYDGSPGSAAQAPRLEDMGPFASERQLRAALQRAQQGARGPVEMARLEAIGSHNAWGSGMHGIQADPAFPGQGHAGRTESGIWAVISLANHSCAPNCTCMTLGSVMFVRAARDLPAGAELTVSYGADAIHQPLAARRELLQRGWRFHCRCARCAAEEALPAALQGAMARLHDATSEGGRLLCAYRQAREAAHRREDPSPAQRLLVQCGDAVGAFERELSAALGSPGGEAARVERATLTGRKSVDLEAALHPGSDTHVQIAAIHMRDCCDLAAAGLRRALGAAPARAKQAAARAARTRYGRDLSDGDVRKLLDRVVESCLSPGRGRRSEGAEAERCAQQ